LKIFCKQLKNKSLQSKNFSIKKQKKGSKLQVHKWLIVSE